MERALPKLVAIVGPTASGKTALGVEIAKRFYGEVISVDSRQVYRDMDIGTAKTEGAWTDVGSRRWALLAEGIPHWGIDLADPDKDFSMAEFKAYAEERIADIVKRKKLPILVGGTGLWLWAVIDNLQIPKVSPDEALRQELEAKSVEELFEEYKTRDPFGADTIDRFNKRRLIRALEVSLTTNQPFSELQKRGEKKYDVLQIGLEVPRPVLVRRIDERVEAMVKRGLVDEVKKLKEKFGCNTPAMSGIGYRQICTYLDGNQTLKEALAEIKKDTRHYAKRQMTWFRRDDRVRWVGEPSAAFPIVEAFLQD